MHTSKMGGNLSKSHVDKASKGEKRLKYAKIELNEQNRIVPVVQFAFHDGIPDERYYVPGIDYDDDIWDEGIGCSVQPTSNTVRVLIRPDVSKAEAKIILTKIIRLIEADESDWGLETDNYLNHWKAKIAEKKRANAVKSKTSRHCN